MKSRNDTSLEMEYPLILVVKEKLTESKHMVKILELIKHLNRPLVIFCEHL